MYKDITQILKELLRVADVLMTQSLQCRTWAVESKMGGWSTHQVNSNIETAMVLLLESERITKNVQMTLDTLSNTNNLMPLNNGDVYLDMIMEFHDKQLAGLDKIICKLDELNITKLKTVPQDSKWKSLWDLSDLHLSTDIWTKDEKKYINTIDVILLHSIKNNIYDFGIYNFCLSDHQSYWEVKDGFKITNLDDWKYLRIELTPAMFEQGK